MFNQNAHLSKRICFSILLSVSAGLFLAGLSWAQADGNNNLSQPFQSDGTPLPAITLTSPPTNAGGLQAGTPTPAFVAPFLFPPYSGSVAENSIFDHDQPDHAALPGNSYVVVFNGRKAECTSATAPPQQCGFPFSACRASRALIRQYC